MGGSAEEFFAELNQRGHDPTLAKVNGRLRIELIHGRRTERWIVTMAGGTVTAERRNGDAEAVIRVDETLFERMCTGEANTLAALLRGAVSVEGDPELMMIFQRALPGPPYPDEAQAAAGTEGEGHER